MTVIPQAWTLSWACPCMRTPKTLWRSSKVSIASGSTPLSVEPFALSHRMTAKSLAAIGEIGGPRCCKRDSFLSILCAIDFAKEQLGVEMEKPKIVCTHFAKNNQCIGKRCPFSPYHPI